MKATAVAFATAEGDSDGSNAVLQNNLLLGSTVATQVTHTFAATGSVNLTCTANGGTAQWTATQGKVIATLVGSASTVAVVS
ncbi:MAG TPA: hypothetical protein VHE14_05650 [Solirubrobacteraceae bacterium]|nr:hypothetical protein [Solirubrobacteraceae bacterium]